MHLEYSSLFAYDTNTYDTNNVFSCKNYGYIENIVKVHEWLCTNKLYIILSKTNYMILSKTETMVNLNLSINNHLIVQNYTVCRRIYRKHI